MICPYCGGEVTEVEPLDENLDAHGQQIREFECTDCGEIMDEDQLDEDGEVIEDSWSEEDDEQDEDDDEDEEDP